MYGEYRYVVGLGGFEILGKVDFLSLYVWVEYSLSHISKTQRSLTSYIMFTAKDGKCVRLGDISLTCTHAQSDQAYPVNNIVHFGLPLGYPHDFVFEGTRYTR